MDAATRKLYWMLEGTRGGPTRLKLLQILDKKPLNTRRLALQAGMDYKTVQGHIELMAKNGILEAQGNAYGAVYFASPEFEKNDYMRKMLRG